MTEKVNASEHEPKPPPSEGSVRLYAETNLPTEFGLFRVAVFLEESSQKEHLAIIRGEIQGKKNLLIRVHSECFTGEVLHSLKCDCKQQLDRALDLIVRRGKGVVLYLRQEGRGIGIINKLKAYNLQDLGLNTVDANIHLGLEVDARQYDIAVEMLKELNVQRINLLTNNPDKIEAFDHSGIEVIARVPLVIPPREENRNYLETKQRELGHFFDLL